MPQPQATVKGLIIAGMKQWILEEYNEKGLDAFYAKLPSEMEKDLRNKLILPISLFPADYFVKAYEAVTSLWGKDIYQKCAGYVAFRDLNSVMKLFMRMGTPALTAGRFPSAWKQYFSKGQFSIVESSPKQLTAVLEDAEEYGKAGCEGALGWTIMALEYAGAKQLKAEHHTCRFRGQDSKCLYRYSWA